MIPEDRYRRGEKEDSEPSTLRKRGSPGEGTSQVTGARGYSDDSSPPGRQTGTGVRPGAQERHLSYGL